ncbi:MAG: radical SAM family heme chaperone HemW [Clostridia bacterium]|nr:radical SAM family heme chaperone HemW [Clostridia bacterium]
MHNKAGLYLHIPFCEKKCAYCDFYSVLKTEEVMKNYISALNLEIMKWGGRIDRPIDTVYIGGGTPSLLCDRIKPLVEQIKKSFKIEKDAEITVELNPNASDDFLTAAKASGVNRISIGAQSASDTQLKMLGRNHTALDTENIVRRVRKLGFDNISLDLMICLPSSDLVSLKKDIDFICELDPEHISAYILKLEVNTRLFRDKSLRMPDEDKSAEQYLFMCKYLEEKGYLQYEISNFCKKGRESRHNLKYWRLDEYIGIGPSAHSFFEGKRFYYPRDLKAFIRDPQILPDGMGGDEQEKLMLSLRLKEGIDLNEYINQHHVRLEKELLKLKEVGLIEIYGTRISLTPQGMLVSNSIITHITELIYENL